MQRASPFDATVDYGLEVPFETSLGYYLSSQLPSCTRKITSGVLSLVGYRHASDSIFV